MMEALPEERIVTEQDSEQCGFNARVCAAMVGLWTHNHHELGMLWRSGMVYCC